MFNFICKTLRSSARSSIASCKLYGKKAGVEVEPSIQAKKLKKDSSICSYLVNRCGFSPEKAISVSNYMNFETLEKPDSVLVFLKNHGFTETQVSYLVKSYPPVLLCDTQNTLLPNIEFFKSLGFQEEEFTRILCVKPRIFTTNLKNQLLPTLDFLKNLLSSPEKIRVPLKRYPQILYPASRALMSDNVGVLREMGVPELQIRLYVQRQPRLFVKESDKFKKILEEVEGLGFEPSGTSFMAAVHVFCSMNKSTWEKKIGIYKKWGLSNDQILEAFSRYPMFMSCSEEKIMGTMDFLVNKMGFRSCDIMKYPLIISYSLKERIIPRCLVYQMLLTKGLLTKPENEISLLHGILKVTEKKFLTKFVECYGKQVPELPRLYQLSCLGAWNSISCP